MSSDTDIRRAYTRAMHDTPTGPDLAEVLTLGRGARRRRAGLRATGAMGLALAVGAAGVLVPRWATSEDRTATPPPAATDFVAGTTTDETMVNAVSAHLPGLRQPRDVFPSNADHNGPMPDADFAAATDWQAEYDVAGGGFFRLLLAHAEQPYVPLCDDCLRTEVTGGRIGTDWSRSLADTDVDHPWTFRVVFQGDDGRIAIATEKVGGATLRSARQARVLTDAQLAALVQDPTLSFPDAAPPDAR